LEQCHTDAALSMSARGQTITAAQTQSVRKIAFAAASTSAAMQLHGPLFQAITGLGHKVVCLTPQCADSSIGSASEIGIESATYDLKPEGWSFLARRRALQALSDTLKESRAHSVVVPADANALLPLLAAEQAGIAQRIAVVAERFDASDAAAAETLRKVFAASTSAVFLNHGDRQAALKAGVLTKPVQTSVVLGAGVDLNAASALPLPPLDAGMVFLIHAPSQQVQHQDVVLQAASAVAIANPSVRVLLSGIGASTDHTLPPGVTVVPPETIENPASALRTALARCHVFVHGPHNEAMPAAVLEAVAAGRPIISTDTGGDRDLVDELVNGCLVAPPSATAYLLAMEIFVKQPDLVAVAARASRLKAERWFDQRDVNQAWLKALALQV
jgi:hypothetical protein